MLAVRTSSCSVGSFVSPGLKLFAAACRTGFVLDASAKKKPTLPEQKALTGQALKTHNHLLYTAQHAKNSNIYKRLMEKQMQT